MHMRPVACDGPIAWIERVVPSMRGALSVPGAWLARVLNEFARDEAVRGTIVTGGSARACGGGRDVPSAARNVRRTDRFCRDGHGEADVGERALVTAPGHFAQDFLPRYGDEQGVRRDVELARIGPPGGVHAAYEVSFGQMQSIRC